MLSKLRSEPVHLRHLVNGSASLPTMPEEVQVDQERLAMGAGVAGPNRVGDQLHPGRGDPGLTILDAGAMTLNELRDSLLWSHALCLVGSASRAAIQRTYDVATALDVQKPTLMCAVDVSREAVPATRDLLKSASLPAFVIPFDSRRTDRGAWGYHQLKRSSHELLRLTAAVTDAVQSERRGQGR
ncbi:hypothetical protein DEO23_12140 [Brachybacterium endophyticum]|uniref:Uncharacterized protein n=1 Tax=Brachybacterium endophyticum TaxID=2182385 RepID=A0A2U2RHL0_9MICO|nr:hypothetical protein [Brachybacterium endophyticum]PWH05338.1 hypothetical protein DEO23_12140 [Brachybacterium endophyticum]